MRQSYFSKAEIAERLRVSARTVDNYVARGLLDRPLKLGVSAQARVRWTAAAVEQLEKNLANAATSRVAERKAA